MSRKVAEVRVTMSDGVVVRWIDTDAEEVAERIRIVHRYGKSADEDFVINRPKPIIELDRSK